MSQTFTSGDCRFDPDRRQLTVNQQTCVLEPRVSALLEYFLCHPQKVISRDELVENVWQGTSVSESAINWTIAQLRKQLADNENPRRYIQTLSKQGYQWLLPVHLVAGAAEAAQQPITTRKSALLHYSGLGLVLLAIFFGYQFVADDEPAHAFLGGRPQPLTALTGAESHPAFSPDGKWLTFVHTDENGRARIMIQALDEDLEFAEYDDTNQVSEDTVPSNRRLAASPLTDSADFIRTPAWAPHGKQLAYMQQNQGNCEIRLLNLNSKMKVTENRLVTDCDERGHSQVSWGRDSQVFYFTNSLDSETYRLFRYQLAEQKISATGPIAKETYGYHLVRVSPSQNHAILVNNVQARVSEFYWMDLDTGETKLLFTRKGNYFDLDWNAEGTGFYLNQSNHELYFYALESGALKLVYSGAANEVYGLVQSPVSNQFAVVHSGTNHESLVYYQFDGSQLKATGDVIDSSFSEWAPALTADGSKAYFLSNRSGLPQIWQQGPDSGESQVSNISNYHQFGQLRTSGSGSILLGESDGQIHSINLNQESSWLHNPESVRAANPLFVQQDNGILYSGFKDGIWQLALTKYSGEITAPQWLTENGGYYAIATGAETVVYSPRDSCGLWQLNLGSLESEKLTDLVCVANPSMAIFNKGIIYADANRSPKGIYYWQPEMQEPLLLLDRQKNKGYGFSATSDGLLLVHRRHPVASDIFLISNPDR